MLPPPIMHFCKNARLLVPTGCTRQLYTFTLASAENDRLLYLSVIVRLMACDLHYRHTFTPVLRKDPRWWDPIWEKGVAFSPLPAPTSWQPLSQEQCRNAANKLFGNTLVPRREKRLRRHAATHRIHSGSAG